MLNCLMPSLVVLLLLRADEDFFQVTARFKTWWRRKAKSVKCTNATLNVATAGFRGHLLLSPRCDTKRKLMTDS